MGLFDEEDDRPKSKLPKTFPRKLDDDSVGMMEEYIAELEAEILKVKAEIQKRGGVKAKAESFFK